MKNLKRDLVNQLRMDVRVVGSLLMTGKRAGNASDSMWFMIFNYPVLE